MHQLFRRLVPNRTTILVEPPVSGHDSFPERHETGVKCRSITVRMILQTLLSIKVEETSRFDSRNHRSVACWLPEAVIVHELSHAYHSISYRDGVTNKKIKEAYEKGVAAGYYDTRRKTCSTRRWWDWLEYHVEVFPTVKSTRTHELRHSIKLLYAIASEVCFDHWQSQIPNFVQWCEIPLIPNFIQFITL